MNREATLALIQKYGLREVMEQFAKASYLYYHWALVSLIPENSRHKRYSDAYKLGKVQKVRWDLIESFSVNIESETRLTECGATILCNILREDSMDDAIVSFVMQKWAGLIPKDYVASLDKSSGSYIYCKRDDV